MLLTRECLEIRNQNPFQISNILLSSQILESRSDLDLFNRFTY